MGSLPAMPVQVCSGARKVCASGSYLRNPFIDGRLATPRGGVVRASWDYFSPEADDIAGDGAASGGSPRSPKPPAATNLRGIAHPS